MPRAVYFDVSALLGLLEGDGAILKVIEDSVDFYTGSIQLAEILGAGALRKKKVAKLRLLMNNFTVLNFSADDALQVSEVIKKVKDSGIDYAFETLASIAQVLRRSLTLVTKNTEMSKYKDDTFHVKIV
ncbi:MAG: type II toxin-antitoxin system VapC family toxin [Candidatus Altiarchaeota archaeon]|nr:type II toxin-antitoxin system VapC family toxin [Candidatus Altiarchaeota archaeon]